MREDFSRDFSHYSAADPLLFAQVINVVAPRGIVTKCDTTLEAAPDDKAANISTQAIEVYQKHQNENIICLRLRSEPSSSLLLQATPTAGQTRDTQSVAKTQHKVPHRRQKTSHGSVRGGFTRQTESLRDGTRTTVLPARCASQAATAGAKASENMKLGTAPIGERQRGLYTRSLCMVPDHKEQKRTARAMGAVIQISKINSIHAK